MEFMSAREAADKWVFQRRVAVCALNKELLRQLWWAIWDYTHWQKNR